MAEHITVVAIDDHPLIRQAVHSLLTDRPDMILMAEGSFGADAFTLTQKHKPDVLLLDLNMPQTESDSGERFKALPTIAKLIKTYPDMSIIILTQYDVPAIIQGAINLGVQGYMSKSDNLSLDLPAAISTVNKGGVFFSETINKMVFENTNKPPVELTARQIEVLTTIATMPNASYAEQARHLKIAESTFKKHLTKANKALGTTNITAAIICCMQLGIIPLSNV